MQLLEVSGEVRPLYGSLGVKGLKHTQEFRITFSRSIPYFANNAANSVHKIIHQK